MTKRAAFTPSDIARALKGGKMAGVNVAVLLRPDGVMEIVPIKPGASVDVGDDMDERMARFAGA